MSNRRISLVHTTGNPNSRQAAIALSEADLLYEVVTTIAYKPDGLASRFLNILPKSLRNLVNRELGRRVWDIPNGVPVRPHLWQEVIRLLLGRTSIGCYLGLSPQSVMSWVCLSLDCHVAKYHLQNIDAIYAYEDVAAETFYEAKHRDILCLYDLPILFHRTARAIQAEEAQHFPELAPVLQGTQEPPWKIERKEREIQLADHIFTASSITKKSLLSADVKPEKISVIPYGAPIDYFYPQAKSDTRFRALFVGLIGPRKGVHYLLQAWQELQLPEAELWLVGTNEFPEGWLESYRDVFRHVPSVPHASLNKYYNAASVLVFPSLVEGFGLVLLEAMACGIPVITTPNTAGPDIFTDGVEGLIVPIRDVEALKEKLEWCYQHPLELAEMGQAARRKAEQLTWGLYRQRLAGQVRKLLDYRNS